MNKKIILSVLAIGILTLTGCPQKVTDTELTNESEVSLTPELNSDKDVYANYNFEEGVHYTVLDKPINFDIDQDYIIKYFWLGCEHCQNFESIISAYKSENEDTLIERRHAAFSDRWALDARVYYALMESGYETIYPELINFYKEMRINNRRLPEYDDLVGFFDSKGVDAQSIFDVADSDLVLSHIESTLNEMRSNNISGVPAIVVNGKYLVSSQLPRNVRTQEDYNNLLNYLLIKGEVE